MKVRTIVVGVDGSPNARRALHAAIELAADDGVIHVVTAYSEPSQAQIAHVQAALPEESHTVFDWVALPRSYVRDAERLLDKQGIGHKGHFVEGGAAGAILDVAKAVDADLIIVGSRGLNRGTRFIRGSVSSRIAGHATTSFMVIH